MRVHSSRGFSQRSPTAGRLKIVPGRVDWYQRADRRCNMSVLVLKHKSRTLTPRSTEFQAHARVLPGHPVLARLHAPGMFLNCRRERRLFGVRAGGGVCCWRPEGCGGPWRALPSSACPHPAAWHAIRLFFRSFLLCATLLPTSQYIRRAKYSLSGLRAGNRLNCALSHSAVRSIKVPSDRKRAFQRQVCKGCRCSEAQGATAFTRRFGTHNVGAVAPCSVVSCLKQPSRGRM